MTINGTITEKVRFWVESDTLKFLDNGLGRLSFDLAGGTFAWTCREALVWHEIRSAFRWQGREYHTGLYERHEVIGEPKELSDAFGCGLQVGIRHEKPGLPIVEQYFSLYEQ